jgi:hypothetical protein
MALTTTQIELLDSFYKSQPALNEQGKPTSEQGLPLGTLIAAMQTKIDDLEARVTALETP